jgi:hypothetical protein
MELFPAANEEAWALIERVIDESDYYVLVIGGRYGSVDEESQVSFTEKEYDYAVAKGKPVLAFLHGDPDAIPSGKTEKSEEAQTRLANFRAKVEKEKLIKRWTNADDLAGNVSRSFAKARQMYPAVGWVRGDVQTSAESLGELNELRKTIVSLEKQLKTVQGEPAAVDAHELSQGSDATRFEIETYTEPLSEEQVYVVREPLKSQLTWDEVFSVIGPLMLDELAQRLIRKQLNTWLYRYYTAQVEHRAEQMMQEDGISPERFLQTKIQLSGDDFHTLLVQYKALGLIEMSERRRAVGDNDTYWTLTPRGEAHLTRLRAVRRSSIPVESQEAESVGSDA